MIKFKTIGSIALLFLMQFCINSNAISVDECKIYGRAFFYESGVDAAIWNSKIDNEGHLEVEFIQDMMEIPTKKEVEKSVLSQENVQQLCKLFRDKEFFTLPKDINTELAPLHEPWFVLEFNIDGKNHRVDFYYPAGAKNVVEVKRFIELWTDFGEKMPIKPPSPANYMK